MPSFRKRLYRRLGWTCVEHGAVVSGDVKLGRGTYVERGAELVAWKGDRIDIGEGSFVLRGALVQSYGGSIQIGSNVGINPYCVIYGHGGLTIGNDVLIATSCIIIPANHNFADTATPIRSQGIAAKGIHIEDNVWLAARVTVLDGVRIGRGAVIGASAVVTKDIPPYAIAVGVPARVVGSRAPTERP